MLDRSLSSSAALSAFAEPFVKARRVVVFGNALSALPRLMLERGARLVHVCDSTLLRATEAAQRYATSGLSFSALGDGDLALRDSAFDTVVVEHLGAFDAKQLVRRARKLLAPRGVALFATPNREVHFPLLQTSEPSAAPLDYYALYDLVAAEFEHVRMFGQSPFVGYAIADFAAEGEIDPVIDSEFVPRGAEEPELFVALAARHRPSLTAYSLIQLPFRNVRAALGTLDGDEKTSATVSSALSLAQKIEAQEAWIAELEGRAEAADARADDAETELENLREALERAEEQRRKLEEPIESAPRAERDPAELERVLAERAELDRLRSEHGALLAEQQRHAVERGELEQLRVSTAALRAQVEGLEHEVEARSVQLAVFEQESSNSEEVGRLEAQLVERASEIRRLERELKEAERIGRELVLELARKPPSAGPLGESAVEPTALPLPAPGAELLAERLAQHAADQYALAWAAEAAHVRATRAEEAAQRLAVELQQAEVALSQARNGQTAESPNTADRR